MDREPGLPLIPADELRQRRQRFEQAATAARRIVHDYGNVLTGILGFSELALGLVPPHSAIASYLKEIHQSGQLGERLTNALRLFTRRHWPKEPPARLATVLADEIRRLRDRHGSAIYEVALPPDLPPLAIAAEPLGHVLTEFFDNAFEAGSSRPIIRVSARTIELTAEQCVRLFGAVEPGEHVAIAVEDNGSGLSAEAQGRLLIEPFFTTKTRHRGYGLAVAYGILVSHHGALSVEPIAGGTVARAFLPIAKVSAAAGGPEPSLSGLKERVLVVDDDPQVLQLAQMTLQRAGFRVETANNAAEALAAFVRAKEPFALVLSDVIMPCLNGFDLARQLKSHDPRVNVLFMSAELMPSPTAPPSDDPFDLIAKPFAPDGLLRAVGCALQRDPRRRTVAARNRDEDVHPPGR
jgi:CheY-like chemotaxis protein